MALGAEHAARFRDSPLNHWQQQTYRHSFRQPPVFSRPHHLSILTTPLLCQRCQTHTNQQLSCTMTQTNACIQQTSCSASSNLSHLAPFQNSTTRKLRRPSTRRIQRCIASTAGSFPLDGNGQPQHSQSTTHNLMAGIGTALRSSIITAFAPIFELVVMYKDILQRVLITLAMLAVFRAGLYIPLPGIDASMLPAPPSFSEGERLVRALYGQAHALPVSLFELGISPYMNASILITLVLAMPEQAVPRIAFFQRLRDARKEGRSGQAYITSIINYLALFISIYLGLVKAVELQPYAMMAGSAFIPLTVLALIAGSNIIMHCANVITSSGIGNGTSLVICCGIITEFADALHAGISKVEAGAVGPAMLLTLGAGYLLLALVAVYICRTELRLPVMQYNRSSVGQEQDDSSNTDNDVMGLGLKRFAAARRAAELRMASRVSRTDYFPLPINGNGMMSIILAGAFWFFMLPAGAELLGLTAVHAGLLHLQQSWLGLFIYSILVCLIEFLPLGGINPKDVAEYFNAMNVGVKGVVPGVATEKHISAQLLRCKFWAWNASFQRAAIMVQQSDKPLFMQPANSASQVSVADMPTGEEPDATATFGEDIDNGIDFGGPLELAEQASITAVVKRVVAAIFASVNRGPLVDPVVAIAAVRAASGTAKAKGGISKGGVAKRSAKVVAKGSAKVVTTAKIVTKGGKAPELRVRGDAL